MRARGEGGPLQVKERGPRRNQPSLHLDLGLPASGLWDNTRLWYLLHGSPSWQRQRVHWALGSSRNAVSTFGWKSVWHLLGTIRATFCNIFRSLLHIQCAARLLYVQFPPLWEKKIKKDIILPMPGWPYTALGAEGQLFLSTNKGCSLSWWNRDVTFFKGRINLLWLWLPFLEATGAPRVTHPLSERKAWQTVTQVRGQTQAGWGPGSSYARTTCSLQS